MLHTLAMKIAVITCYAHPDYVRATTLRSALIAQPKTDVIIIKNRHKGLLRYPEVVARLIWLRITKRPDVYLLTFRAYEILPLAALLTWPKKLVYDEFLNPLEWLREERKEWWARLVPQKSLKSFYRSLIRRCSLVLTDTDAHAIYSQEILGLSSAKFVGLPVGADETIFHPLPTNKSKHFTVFYYGTMIPLHGIDIVLKAAELLKDKPVRFVFCGGDSITVRAVREAQAKGANIEHHLWLPFEKLADMARSAHLTLGGPFGDTPQASMVVTGKTYQFMATGAPVLVGKTKANSDFIHRNNCLMTPLGDPEELAKQIQWAQQNPKKLANIAKAGYELYCAKFSSTALATEVSTLLRQLF